MMVPGRMIMRHRGAVTVPGHVPDLHLDMGDVGLDPVLLLRPDGAGDHALRLRRLLQVLPEGEKKLKIPLKKLSTGARNEKKPITPCIRPPNMSKGLFNTSTSSSA